MANDLTDSRKRKQYPISEIIFGALFMNIFKEGSRNAFNNDLREDVFKENIFKYFGMNLPHGDATDDVLRVLPPKELDEVKAGLASKLIEQKAFRNFRFLGKYYLVAVDATGLQVFDKRHCEHCLTKTSKNGVVSYFHYVLEAKLVTRAGHAISLATEFIENDPSRGFDKQDCEQKAFVRLSKKIKKDFPRLPVCILADGLYPNNTVFDICDKHNWKFIITLKDGNLKSFQEETILLKGTAHRQSVFRADKTSETTLRYAYLNDIEYSGRHFSWVECRQTVVKLEEKKTEEKKFVYITNVRQEPKNNVETADSGRIRWKIENEGFNTQKNGGYRLEHKFSRTSYPAMQNYYILLQIAHMINQLVERTGEVAELMTEHSKQTLVDLWKKLIAYLVMVQVDDSNWTKPQDASALPYQPG